MSDSSDNWVLHVFSSLCKVLDSYVTASTKPSQIIKKKCAWFFCLNLPLSPVVISTKKPTFRLKNHINTISDILYRLENDKCLIWNQVMTISYVLDKRICDIFSFSVAKPADSVPFRQACMYQHKNVHISAHIQNRLLLWAFFFLVRTWEIMWCIFHFDLMTVCFASLLTNISGGDNWPLHCIWRIS